MKIPHPHITALNPGHTISPHKVFRILLSNLAGWFVGQQCSGGREIFKNTGAADDKTCPNIELSALPALLIQAVWWLWARLW